VQVKLEYYYIGEGRKFDDGEIEIIPFVIKLIVILLLVSNLNNTSKYEADVEHSVVSLISSSLGYIESTYEWN
jgi:hypothetical protein